jgi:predicted hotdog family 3-hydroxylacyl-ACP dehydratase
MAGFPPIEELLPHRGAMLFVDSVVSGDENSIVVAATVPEAAWYLDERGGMPAWIGIELMAQAIAAHTGLQGRLRGVPPKRGVLLGTRAYHSRLASLRPGTRLLVAARITYMDEGGFGAFDCTIKNQMSEELASATLKVFEPGDFAAFIAAQAGP